MTDKRALDIDRMIINATENDFRNCMNNGYAEDLDSPTCPICAEPLFSGEPSLEDDDESYSPRNRYCQDCGYTASAGSRDFDVDED